jgi:hypothetical protein
MLDDRIGGHSLPAPFICYSMREAIPEEFHASVRPLRNWLGDLRQQIFTESFASQVEYPGSDW